VSFVAVFCLTYYTYCDVCYTYIQGVVVLSIALAEEPEDHIQAAAAWSLGQIGRHTPEHSKAVAQANVFPRLLQCYIRTGASEDLQTKVFVDVLIVDVVPADLETP